MCSMKCTDVGAGSGAGADAGAGAGAGAGEVYGKSSSERGMGNNQNM